MMYFLFLTVLISRILLVNCGEQANSASACYWKDWSRWSDCSISCGGGVSTRHKTTCYCPGKTNSTASLCPGTPDKENLPCNQFVCGTQPPENKLYWESHNSQKDGTAWPMNENTYFSCSDHPNPTIESKSFLQIMLDPIYTDCSTWHQLAKEFIAAECNVYNKITVTDDLREVISEAGILLDTCCVLTNGQIHQASVLREELNRANNGLGGLWSAYEDNGTESDDDGNRTSVILDDTAVTSATQMNAAPPSDSRKILVIVLSVCSVLFVVIVAAIVIWVVMVRRRQKVVAEDHQFLNEENKEVEGGGEGTEIGEEE